VARARVVLQLQVCLVLGAEPLVVMVACLEPVVQPAVQGQEVAPCLVLAVLAVEVSSLVLPAALAAEVGVCLVPVEVVAYSAQVLDQAARLVYLEEELAVFLALRERATVDQVALDSLVLQAAQAVQAVAQLVGVSLEQPVQVLLLTSWRVCSVLRVEAQAAMFLPPAVAAAAAAAVAACLVLPLAVAMLVVSLVQLLPLETRVEEPH